MNNFVWAVITLALFRISGASQAYFGSLKGCYQCGYYCRERLYSQISLKVWDSEEKLAFSSRLPLRRHCTIIRPWHCCKLLRKRSSSTHKIFWPSEDSSVEVGPRSVAAILFSNHRVSLSEPHMVWMLRVFLMCSRAWFTTALDCEQQERLELLVSDVKIRDKDR